MTNDYDFVCLNNRNMNYDGHGYR